MNCFATMGDEQSAQSATLGEASQSPAETKPHLSADPD